MTPESRIRRGGAAAMMAALNARHPWSHNDHFHAWVRSRLPDRRHSALDVGCGCGELLAMLAECVDQVRGIDVDAEMRRVASARCSGLANVRVDDAELEALAGPFDVVTMIAVLHHLDVENALRVVSRLLAPGGRFLCVGLARPSSVVDHAWDAAGVLTNPVIGFVKHPWVSHDGVRPPSFPVAEPHLTFAEIKAIADRVMPGARMHRRLGFRHTLEWTKPVSLQGV